jgi:hypothetical protein
MTTRIESVAPASLVEAHPAAHRTTAPPLRPFQSVMNAGAGAVVSGAEAAVRRLPGGPILAAAFHPTSGPAPALAPSTSAVTPEGYPTGAPLPPGSPGMPATGSGAADPALEGMLGENTDRNLYYIALQERISAENRLYSAYSNVLRVRHETMKNAIGNVR